MMNPEDFYSERDDRQLRYAGRVLELETRIAITASAPYLATVAGQAAALTITNLLARMARGVTLSFPDVPLQAALARGTGSLHQHCLAVMRGANPPGDFRVDEVGAGDYRIHLGPDGHDWVIHGTDWNAYVGPSPSPLGEGKTANPYGAQFATVMGVSQVFKDWYPATVEAISVNLLHNAAGFTDEAPWITPGHFLGRLWFVGAGAVGSATAYSLTFSGARFDPTIFDMDVVKVLNLDRSPTSAMEDATKNKAVALEGYLRRLGWPGVAVDKPLDQSRLWMEREPGSPDAVISAANERNVRYVIETQFPPLQVYATTGKQWQATVLRHIPMVDPCSCCVFGTDAPVTTCAGGQVPLPENPEQKVDAALPFLSFAAGILAAAELVKVALNVHTVSPNRAFFNSCSDEVLVTAPTQLNIKCGCRTRSASVHRRMIESSLYESLSHPEKKQGYPPPLASLPPTDEGAT